MNRPPTTPRPAGHPPRPRFARRLARANAAADARGGAAHRRELLCPARGHVVEVGCGDGLNFPAYPAAVARVTAVEPEPTLRDLATRAAASAPVSVTVVDGVASRLPVGDGEAEAVVFSQVLCSVGDVPAALREARRVLAPGGVVLLYEHIRSDRPVPAALQTVVSPLWARAAGGCRLDVDLPRHLAAAGFAVDARRFGFAPSPGAPPVTFLLGTARPA